METFWGSGSLTHASLTSAVGGGEWSASRSGRFIHEERTCDEIHTEYEAEWASEPVWTL